MQMVLTSFEGLQVCTQTSACLAQGAQFLLAPLTQLSCMQDLVLSCGSLRKLSAYALGPCCHQPMQMATREPGSDEAFGKLRYHVSAEARNLLKHAAWHGEHSSRLVQA